MKNRPIGFSLFDFAIQFVVGAIGIMIIGVAACIIGIVSLPIVVSVIGIWVVWNIISSFKS